MINIDQIHKIHQVLIKEFGGSNGVRDKGLLNSATKRPFSGFGETEFYPTPVEKAAAILESIVKNHPFIDGNKRTGYVLMRLFLMQLGEDIQASQEEKYDFVIEVASGKLDYDGIVAWLREKAQTVS